MTGIALAVVLQTTILAADAQDFPQAFQRSAATGRPLVVLMGAKWCPACRVMNQKTIPEVCRLGGMANVEYAYVDIDKNRQLAGKLLRGNSIPQLIRLDQTQDGWTSRYLIEAQSVKQITDFVSAGGPVQLTGHQTH
jgi:thiol-disulfide isomerase/thioredoxin